MRATPDQLIAQLDRSIATMTEIRRPDPTSSAAFDALKQARALIARAFSNESHSLRTFTAPPFGSASVG
jgi:hypothetical protein